MKKHLGTVLFLMGVYSLFRGDIFAGLIVALAGGVLFVKLKEKEK